MTLDPQPFVRRTGVAALLDGRNVDTDQIIPARFLKFDRADGYGRFLFHDLRFDGDGGERPGFVLNQPGGRGATMLIAGDNFGCGSSREGAVYALQDYGICAVIAPSFGDIFFNNCLKNGVVPVRLPEAQVAALRGALAPSSAAAAAAAAAPPVSAPASAASPLVRLTVDLAAQTIAAVPAAAGADDPPVAGPFPFTIDAFWRECLMKGTDEVGLTLALLPEIEAYERRDAAERPWLQPPATSS
ncbi:MAG: 3-isopropylmalate dehydratase small subunit [Lautropia sp.]